MKNNQLDSEKYLKIYNFIVSRYRDLESQIERILMINIAICEDEIEIQNLLENYVNDILKNISIEYEIQKYNSGEELIEDKSKNIDILLLDIQMGKINGMDTARKLRSEGNKMEIIFITSLVDYIKEGYEVRAYRYLLKPIDLEEIKEHMITLINEIKINKYNYILIKNKSNTYKIHLKDIKYIEVHKRYVLIHTIKKDIELTYSLAKLEKELNLDKFVRCHKSFIVNLEYVENIKQNVAILEDDEEIPVSKHRYKNVRLKFLNFIGDNIC